MGLGASTPEAIPALDGPGSGLQLSRSRHRQVRIDDAVRLVREALPEHQVHLNISMSGRREAGASLSTDPDSASAHLMPPRHAGLDLTYRMEGGLRTAATAPIAIVLALLEALITQLRDQD